MEGAIHNPPTDIVWRSQDSWGSSKKTITKLVSSGREVHVCFTSGAHNDIRKGKRVGVGSAHAKD